MSLIASAPASAGRKFGRDLRLLSGKQFNAVFDHKKRLHGGGFTIHVAPNDTGHARIGLAVSRRVSKKAVARNRLKRLIRESFRHHQHELGAVDYVVIAKVAAAAAANRALRDELDGLWGRARQKFAMH